MLVDDITVTVEDDLGTSDTRTDDIQRDDVTSAEFSLESQDSQSTDTSSSENVLFSPVKTRSSVKQSTTASKRTPSSNIKLEWCPKRLKYNINVTHDYIAPYAASELVNKILYHLIHLVVKLFKLI